VTSAADADAGEPGAVGSEVASSNAAWWVGAGILLSRIAGFVRQAVVAFYLGSSRTADLWTLALRTPNVIQNLLGEGTLSASFIPVYARMLEEGREEEAGRFAGAALGLVATAAFGAALLGILAAPLVVNLLFPALEPDAATLLVAVIRIMLPMTATLAVSAWALGVLNTHRRFFVSYVAPVLWNAAIIAAAVTAGTVLGFEAAGREGEILVALAWGALAGGVAQLTAQIPFLVPVLRHFRLSVSVGVAGVKEALRAFGPVVAARGVVNLSGLLDAVLAALLVEGAVINLGRAQTLYLLPISLFGMAVAASELPELSRARGAGAARLADRVRKALEGVTFFLVPSVAAYLTLGDVFIEALLERGDFGRDDTMVVWAVLSAYSLGLLASGRSRTLSSAFFALQDTATPARIAVARVALSVVVGVALMFPFDRLALGELRFGAVGLALGSAAGAWLEYGLMRRQLARRIPGHGPRGTHLSRLVVAAAVAAGGGLAAQLLVSGPVRAMVPAWMGGPVMAAGTGGVFGVLYLGVSAALGVGTPVRRILRR
jgi:putative peptidoglycan lipid II flippase